MPAPRLTVRTLPVADPGPLLPLLPTGSPLAWVRGNEGLVGWGEAASVRVTGASRFVDAEAWWTALAGAAEVEDDVRLPGSGLVCFGSFAFDGARAASMLVVPSVVVGQRDGVWWVTTVDGADDVFTPGAPAAPVGLTLSDDAPDGADWTEIVAEGVARIEAGEVSKVVLARAVVAQAEEPVDLRWPLQELFRDYPSCWTFAVEGLVGATPEMLVRLRDGVATSRVLAGTLRRSGDSNEDLRRGGMLPRSIKDVEEHGYAVTSVADSLAPHVLSIDVPAAPFVLELPNVMHLATDVRAVVRPGTSSLALAASLHPSAAVCGTPTAEALAVITELEGMERGRYAGPVGWTGASGDGEWGIALRCAQVDLVDPSRLRLFAGCGIVAGSKPRDELAESVAKLMPMTAALTTPA